jgi:hypothetical protein
LARSLEPGKTFVEAEYLRARPAFERPYGLAWLLLLASELAASRDPAARRASLALEPVAAAARANLDRWLRGLRYPVRSGTHHQTAFALTLLFDVARAARDRALLAAVRASALALYADDGDLPLELEPSGEDFLSPSLMEADLMRRMLARSAFGAWLTSVLPGIPRDEAEPWLACGEVVDETDGKAVHLHGLNLSRAWNLANVASALPRGDSRKPALRRAAERHAVAGLRATLAATHYAGDHWLPTFAVYLLTGGSEALPRGRVSSRSAAARSARRTRASAR